MNRENVIVGALLVAGLFAPLRLSQQGYQGEPELQTLKRELEALKEGQARIEKQLQEIKSLLNAILASRPTEPPEVTLGVGGAPWKGMETARVVLIEFSDYQCPFCARHVQETLPQLERDYIQTGKVRYVVRDFPLPIHRQAFKAAEAARCAADQGKFWEMRAQLFQNQGALEIEALMQHAQVLALELPKFQHCLQEGRHAEAIRRDLEEGRRAGVRGTPTFFLGSLESDGTRVKVQKVIVGAQPYTAFKEAIESLLAAPRP